MVNGEQLSAPSWNLVAEFAVGVFSLALDHLGALEVHLNRTQTLCSDFIAPGWGPDVGICRRSVAILVAPGLENLLSSSPPT